MPVSFRSINRLTKFRVLLDGVVNGTFQHTHFVSCGNQRDGRALVFSNVSADMGEVIRRQWSHMGTGSSFLRPLACTWQDKEDAQPGKKNKKNKANKQPLPPLSKIKASRQK